MKERKKYYSERIGQNKTSIRLPHLRLAIWLLFDKYNKSHYFQDAFGYKCVDIGYVAGRMDVTMGKHITLEFMGKKVWPIEEYYDKWDENTCFDIIEYLHELVAKPTSKSFHSWNNCGWHVYKADISEGQKEFRKDVNEYLSRYKEGKFELMPNGEIYLRGPEELKKVISSRPQSKDIENIENKVKRAIHKFSHFTTNIDEKMEAIRILADVLEFLKPEIAEHMLRKDGSRLFEIANTFSFRHHNGKQRIDYDKDIWSEWIFYSYLNTINTLNRKIAKDKMVH